MSIKIAFYKLNLIKDNHHCLSLGLPINYANVNVDLINFDQTNAN